MHWLRGLWLWIGAPGRMKTAVLIEVVNTIFWGLCYVALGITVWHNAHWSVATVCCLALLDWYLTGIVKTVNSRREKNMRDSITAILRKQD
jgi:hypothetical protein